ncbi:hypothetical protein [Arthrobacter castelli]|uniref:hypothetical protein n=1 Tax=Arthrobacter castelli TaxID=271431 RepID=UPI000401FA6C|nr:hypothetical protein [Arthrobacter castelli]
MTLDRNEHPEAREEFLDAHERYLGVGDGRLGDEFVDAAEAAAELILRWPEAPPPYGGQRRDPMIRTWHLDKFPHRLLYVVRDGLRVIDPKCTRGG